MIHRAKFENFKALRDVEIELGRLNVLVGPNASGKTSILEGIHGLAQFAGNFPDPQAFSEWLTFSRFQTRDTAGSICLLLESELFGIRIKTTREGKQLAEVRDMTSPDAKWKIYNSRPLTESFGLDILLQFVTSRLTAPSYSEQAVPQIKFNGEGLPSVLVYMKLNMSEQFDRLVDALRQIVPTIRGIRFVREKITRTETQVVSVGEQSMPMESPREYWGDAILFDTELGNGIESFLMSEGTLLVTGLLAVVMGPQQPRTVLLDDMDRTLHPKAQAELVGILRRLLEERPELQIVATSHSPYLLDSLQLDEVHLTVLDDDGTVKTARLDKHPDVDRWKGVMTPGEFWSSVGEDWVRTLESKGTDP